MLTSFLIRLQKAMFSIYIEAALALLILVLISIDQHEIQRQIDYC